MKRKDYTRAGSAFPSVLTAGWAGPAASQMLTAQRENLCGLGWAKGEESLEI